MPAEWDPEVDNWVRWARTPGFDAYWYFRDAFFADVLPPPGSRTLEIGCGEGRVAWDLAARGHHVIAADNAAGLVRHARDEDGEGRYLVADSSCVPLSTGCVDTVVAYNVLQVVPDMAATVAECARVLRPSGHLCFCVVHPITDMGRWSGDHRFSVRNDYFTSTRVEDTVEVDGLRMTFRGWTHTLEEYSLALEDAGLRIELIREPRPAPDVRYQRWSSVPLFMNIRAVKRQTRIGP